MRIVVFCHSLISDWNHGNAHFLRGLVTELSALGHRVAVYEPRDAWSIRQLVAEHGTAPLAQWHRTFPALSSRRYDPRRLDLDEALRGASLVLVHEWNDPELVRRIGEHRARAGRYRLLFHDTHHRSVSDPDAIAAFDLTNYDAILAFGRAVADRYRAQGWRDRVFVWHEAADLRVFRPRPSPATPDGDVVWIGNWGDDERTAELDEFFLEPVRRMGLAARVYGVRYPPPALARLAKAGIEYGGWLPNAEVPEVFARFRATVHIPRGPYRDALPGVPTIRVFEALACGIPLACSPWNDVEGLFRPGEDYAVARNGRQMRRVLARLLGDREFAARLAASGLARVRARHTCAHRVAELFAILEALDGAGVEGMSRTSSAPPEKGLAAAPLAEGGLA